MGPFTFKYRKAATARYELPPERRYCCWNLFSIRREHGVILDGLSSNHKCLHVKLRYGLATAGSRFADPPHGLSERPTEGRPYFDKSALHQEKCSARSRLRPLLTLKKRDRVALTALESEILANRRNKRLINPIPSLAGKLRLIDLPGDNTAKHRAGDVSLFFALGEIDAP